MAMLALKEVAQLETHHLIERILSKSQPQQNEAGDHTVKRFSSGDIMFTSGRRTEVTPLGERLPSAIIVSPLGRRILAQNQTFLRDLLECNWPQRRSIDGNHILRSSFSLVRLLTVNLDDQEQLMVIKYHDEGYNCYPHLRSEPAVVKPDRVSGIGNFLALRAIGLFAPDLSVPEPILATRRIFVAPFIEGQKPGNIPGWVEKGVSFALNRAYKLGWLQKPDKWLGFIPRGYRLDLRVDGNLLEVDGRFFIIDPIA